MIGVTDANADGAGAASRVAEGDADASAQELGEGVELMNVDCSALDVGFAPE